MQTMDENSRQGCEGMYSKKAWGGQVAPYILPKFIKHEGEGDPDPIASLVIFEWKDEKLIGRPSAPDSPYTVSWQLLTAILVMDTIGAKSKGCHRHSISVTTSQLSRKCAKKKTKANTSSRAM